MNWLNETADRADHSELEFLADFIVLNEEEHIYTTFINGDFFNCPLRPKYVS